MPRSSSCRARSTGSPTCGQDSDGDRGRGAAAGVYPDRARPHPQAKPDAAGNAMARARAADLLRLVSDAPDPDAGEGRPQQGPGRGRRRRSPDLGARDVAALPRLAPLARAHGHRRAGLHLDLPGRDALADLCRARGVRQSLWRHRAGARLRRLFRPNAGAAIGVCLKLILMPAIAVALALLFGLTGANLVIVTACAAVPASSSAYVLARQMGGDAPLLAQIITLQTILAAITMPVAIALVA